MSDKLVEASRLALDAWNGEGDESTKRLIGAMQDLSDALEEGDNVPPPENPDREVITRLRAALRRVLHCPAIDHAFDTHHGESENLKAIDEIKRALEFAAENEAEYSPKTAGANTHGALVGALEISSQALEVAIDHMNADVHRALVRKVIDKTREVLAAAKEAG